MIAWLTRPLGSFTPPALGYGGGYGGVYMPYRKIAPTRVGASVTAINAWGTATDGEPAWIAHSLGMEELRWNASTSKWESAAPLTLKGQGDTWAMGPDAHPALTGGPRALRTVFFAGSDRANTALTAQVDLSAAAFDFPGGAGGTLQVASTAAGHGPAFLTTTQAYGNNFPYIRVRDNFLTGEVGSSTTLVNCRVVQGSRGVIPVDEMVAQGDAGGWGFTTTGQAVAADDLWTAGLRPEVSLRGLLCSGFGTPEKRLTAQVYWHQLDVGDVAPSPPDDGAILTGGLGVCGTLMSLTGTNADGGGERSVYMTVPSPLWSTWSLAAPSKAFLVPWIACEMESGAVHPGMVLDLLLLFRWVSA